MKRLETLSTVFTQALTRVVLTSWPAMTKRETTNESKAIHEVGGFISRRSGPEPDQVRKGELASTIRRHHGRLLVAQCGASDRGTA